MNRFAVRSNYLGTYLPTDSILRTVMLITSAGTTTRRAIAAPGANFLRLARTADRTPYTHPRPFASSLFGLGRQVSYRAGPPNSAQPSPIVPVALHPLCLLAALPSTISSRVHFHPHAVRFWLKDGMPRHPLHSCDDDDSNYTPLLIRRPLC